MKTILKAVRVPDYDMVGDEHYGDTPYGVVLDVYDTDDNFIENGTDWSYFATEEEAEKFCNEYNKRDMRVYVIDTTNLDKGFEEMTEEELMAESERQGRVYSKQGFQRAFNEEELNTNTDIILIK